jgi:predicted nuclease of restriction endonuclease-like (RecB) superfamily
MAKYYIIEHIKVVADDSDFDTIINNERLFDEIADSNLELLEKKLNRGEDITELLEIKNYAYYSEEEAEDEAENDIYNDVGFFPTSYDIVEKELVLF